MKQNITVKQLNELDEKGLGKLHKSIGSGEQMLLSIGQMIEFLTTDKFKDEFLGINRFGDDWKVEFELGIGAIVTKRQLCNALWEAVKKMLKK